MTTRIAVHRFVVIILSEYLISCLTSPFWGYTRDCAITGLFLSYHITLCHVLTVACLFNDISDISMSAGLFMVI